MTRYLIVIEKANENFSAYSPDVDGCVAAGETREDTLNNMKEAIEFHLQGMKEDGLPLPEGQASAEYVAI
jgi:predicted RNase H-like HicB family nuclease